MRIPAPPPNALKALSLPPKNPARNPQNAHPDFSGEWCCRKSLCVSTTALSAPSPRAASTRPAAELSRVILHNLRHTRGSSAYQAQSSSHPRLQCVSNTIFVTPAASARSNTIFDTPAASVRIKHNLRHTRGSSPRQTQASRHLPPACPRLWAPSPPPGASDRRPAGFPLQSLSRNSRQFHRIFNPSFCAFSSTGESKTASVPAIANPGFVLPQTISAISSADGSRIRVRFIRP